MDEPRNPTDTQTILQSMLQRLKLQQGREGQEHLHTPAPVTASSTQGQDGETGASNLQNGPVNGFEFGSNGFSSKRIGSPTLNSDFSFKGHGFGVDKGLTSSPTQKNNSDGDTGESRVSGQATQPGITLAGSGRLFPAQSHKDADITSFKMTDTEPVSPVVAGYKPDSRDTDTSVGQNQTFTPKVYAWSLKPADANHNTGGQENNVVHVGNGGLGDLGHSNQKTSTSSLRSKHRSSGNRSTRWTQKIKERWRDRQGSFGKKAKEENQKSEQGTELSTQNQLLPAQTGINTSNKEGESGDPIQTPPLTEDNSNDEQMRSSTDFEFSLGSFSLLDEIVMGQEWGNFLNPNLSATSTYQSPSEEFKIQPNPAQSGRSTVIPDKKPGVSSRWSFRGAEDSQDVSMAPSQPDGLQPVSMDLSEEKQQQEQQQLPVPGDAALSEPMEHGQNQTDMQTEESGQRRRTFWKPEDILNNSSMRNRLQTNRKRQHQSAENLYETPQPESRCDEKESSKDESMVSLAGGSQQDNAMPLYNLNASAAPLSPSSPFAPAPKGVLKHSISRDSESPVELVSKRRRLEDNRRVRFSEEIVTIEPPELDPDATDSEEDTEEEEDSVIEEDFEAVPAVTVKEEEEEAPARRSALPAWILALKRKNTGRKWR